MTLQLDIKGDAEMCNFYLNQYLISAPASTQHIYRFNEYMYLSQNVLPSARQNNISHHDTRLKYASRQDEFNRTKI